MPLALAAGVLIFNFVFMGWTFAKFLSLHDLITACTSAALLLIFYVVGRIALNQCGVPDERRKRAWLLAPVAATVLSLYGTMLAFKLLRSTPQEFAFLVSSDPSMSRECLIFFAVEMLLDLALGFFEYPEHLSPITGYFHHTFFLVVSHWVRCFPLG